MASFRRIVEDFEAHLAPPDSAIVAKTGAGKAEHERFEDGEVQFEVRGRDLAVAEGTELEVRLNGVVVARTVVSQGRISLRLSNQHGNLIPAVRAGDRLEVAHRSVVLLEGSFRPD
jgi:hypothetical protein